MDKLEIILQTQEDVDELLTEYESGNLVREALICSIWISHTLAYQEGLKNKGKYTFKELSYIAGLYSMACEQGYKGSFLSWFSKLGNNWRELCK